MHWIVPDAWNQWKKLPNKNSNQERPSKEYTKMYIFIVRSCGRRKKKNGNKEQSSRFTAAPKHLLSFIAKKPTTMKQKKKSYKFRLIFSSFTSVFWATKQKLKDGLESESNLNSVRELITEWKSLNEGENLEMKSLYLKKFADQ